MPCYDYICSCGHSVEKFHNMKERIEVRCEKCNDKMKKAISPGLPPVFVGSGFYENDYKNK